MAIRKPFGQPEEVTLTQEQINTIITDAIRYIQANGIHEVTMHKKGDELNLFDILSMSTTEHTGQIFFNTNLRQMIRKEAGARWSAGIPALLGSPVWKDSARDPVAISDILNFLQEFVK